MEAVINDDLGDEDFSPLSNAFAKKIKNIDGPMIRSIVLISPWSKSVKFREKADVETCEPPVDSDGADDKPTVDMGSEFGNKVTAVNVTRAANGLLNSFASIANDAPCKKKVNFCSLTTNELVDHADLAIPLESIEEVNNRFVNTLYGYFIGKRLAFPIVENYVKNTWAKYGIERVMLKNDFFFFKFSTRKGMEQVLENGPWLIRTIPIILNTWDLNTILKKDEITNVPIWVKLHNIPVAAYSEVGLSLIGTMIGKPIMLDAYTCDMCLKLWGQTGYARALIEVSSVTELRDSLVIAIPFLNKTGHSLETIKIEYEWQPPRCLSCKIFGHIDEQCPKSCKAVTRLMLIKLLMSFVEVNKRKGKGNQVSKEKHIDGIRFSKPKVAFHYRWEPKGGSVKGGASSVGGTSSSGTRTKSTIASYNLKDPVPAPPSNVNSGLNVKATNSFGVLDSLVDEDILGDDNNGKGTQDQRSSNTEPKTQGEPSKPSSVPSSSTSTKRGNPFSKVGEVVDSDSDEDEVYEPNENIGNYFSSSGRGIELEDFFSDDYAAQVYDLPGQLNDFKLQGHATK